MKLSTVFALACMMTLLAIAAQFARAQNSTDDIPHLPPAASTAFVCSVPGTSKIVAVVVSYSNGAVVRFDGTHMHGFNVSQMMRYSDSAKDTMIYDVPCADLP